VATEDEWRRSRWAKKWVSNNVDWWMDGDSEDLEIRRDDTDPRNKEPKDAS
jgi:hypothetical protein